MHLLRPRTRLLIAAGLAGMAIACASPAADGVRVLIYGEQHDQIDQQRQVAQAVGELAAGGRLAALVLEMADRGTSTAGLPPQTDDAGVRAALRWNDNGWPWVQYGPVVMAAVRAGVPVLGGNLPRAGMKAAMGDDSLDRTVPDSARRLLTEAVRTGHCNLLPTTQEPGMVRVQIARDRSMAQTVQGLLPAAPPPSVVLLLTGAQHASRDRGVPLHLNEGGTLPTGGVRVLMFGGASAGLQADDRLRAEATPRPDPCVALRERMQAPAPKTP